MQAHSRKAAVHEVQRGIFLPWTPRQQARLCDLHTRRCVDLKMKAGRVLRRGYREPYPGENKPQCRGPDDRTPGLELGPELIQVVSEARFTVVQIQWLVARESDHAPSRGTGWNHHPQHEVVGQAVEYGPEHAVPGKVQNRTSGRAGLQGFVCCRQRALVTADYLMDKRSDRPVARRAGARPAARAFD